MTAIAEITTSAWIDSQLFIQKQADILQPPSSINGNIDCYEDEAACVMPTSYGVATTNSTVKINSSSTYSPVHTYIDGRAHFLPVLNSDTVISYTTDPVYGVQIYFNYNFHSSVSMIYDGLSPLYKINRPPDAVLVDKAGNRLAADPASMSFSPNGQWMVVSEPNVAMLKVNLSTFEVTAFAPGFNYTIGLDPSIKTAITNDGRYAAIASKEFNSFNVYDLSTCSPQNNIPTTKDYCQARDLQTVIKKEIPNLKFIDQARFLDDERLSVYLNYSDTNKITRLIISTSGAGDQLDHLALGDSYISGEGTFDYQPETDSLKNKCHLSFLSYPYLIGKDLNYNSYRSVACSGAMANDITDAAPNYTGQADNREISVSQRPSSFIDDVLASFKPGYVNQLAFVEEYQPQSIAVSIGGNDIGFSKILTRCVELKLNNTCYADYEDRLELINEINNVVYPRLLNTYQKLKSAGPPDIRIYIIGYPQIAKTDGNCALNVHLNSDELLFAQQLVNYLDSVIKTAADRTGVFYVNTQEALLGHRLCEAGPGSVAMNGLTAGNDTPALLHGPIGNESYHPNVFGHELLENKVLEATHNLTDTMPAPNLEVNLPQESDLDILSAPHNGRVVNITEYDPGISTDLTFQGSPTDFAIDGSQHALAPLSTIYAEIHSMPIPLGNFTADNNGNLSGQVTIPSTVPAGYHTLHFYGADIAGQKIDIYKDIYVATSADDIDGNGIVDSTQKCVGVEGSNQDFDHDGVDDACDADIASSPAQTVPQTNITGSISLGAVIQNGEDDSNKTDPIMGQISNMQANSPQPKTLGLAISQKEVRPADKNNLRLQSKTLVFGLGLILLASFFIALF